MCIVFGEVGGVTLTEEGYSFTESVGDLLARSGFVLSNRAREKGRMLEFGSKDIIISTVTSTDLDGVGLSSSLPEPRDSLLLLANNGITVVCPKDDMNNRDMVNRTTYTKRTRDQTTVANAATTCTTGIDDMSYLRICLDRFINFIANISIWDTSQVSNMARMFWGGTSFNRDIG